MNSDDDEDNNRTDMDSPPGHMKDAEYEYPPSLSQSPAVMTPSAITADKIEKSSSHRRLRKESGMVPVPMIRLGRKMSLLGLTLEDERDEDSDPEKKFSTEVVRTEEYELNAMISNETCEPARDFLKEALEIHKKAMEVSSFSDLVKCLQKKEQFSVLKEWINLDKDGNGKISSQELKWYLEKRYPNKKIDSQDLEALHWCLDIDHRGLSKRAFISSTCLDKAQSYTISRLLNAHTSSESYLLVAVLGINFNGQKVSIDETDNVDRDGNSYSTQVSFEKQKKGEARWEEYHTFLGWDRSHYMFAMETKDTAIPIVKKMGIEKGVIVKILHESTHQGGLATVVDPDFEGRIRVRIEADKSLRTYSFD
jgi:hypothetical protein